MTVNLIANMVFVAMSSLMLGEVLFLLITNNYEYFLSFIVLTTMFFGSLIVSCVTPTHTKITITPIVHITNTKYATRQNGSLKYHNFPKSYKVVRTKAKHSYIKETSHPDFSLVASNLKNDTTVYYLNPNQK